VDGAWLGVSNLIPEFDVSPSEYVNIGFSFNQIAGTVNPGQFAPNSIPAGVLQNGAVNSAAIQAGAVGTTQLGTNVVTGGVAGNIALGTITAANLAASVVLGIPGGFSLVMATTGTSCPPGWVDLTGTPSAVGPWAGLTPVGIRPDLANPINLTGQVLGTRLVNGTISTGANDSDHSHSINGGWNTHANGGGNDSIANSTNGESNTHAHAQAQNFITVRYCQAP
jgi:hypothetical protein